MNLLNFYVCPITIDIMQFFLQTLGTKPSQKKKNEKKYNNWMAEPEPEPGPGPGMQYM